MPFRVSATGFGPGKADFTIDAFIKAGDAALGSNGDKIICATKDGFAAVAKNDLLQEDCMALTDSQVSKLLKTYSEFEDELTDDDNIINARSAKLRAMYDARDKLGEHLTLGQRIIRFLGGRRNRARKFCRMILRGFENHESLRPVRDVLDSVRRQDEGDAWVNKLNGGAKELAEQVVGKRLAHSEFSDEQYAVVALNMLEQSLPAEPPQWLPEAATEDYQLFLSDLKNYGECLRGNAKFHDMRMASIDVVETTLARTISSLKEANHDRDYSGEAATLDEIANRPHELPQSYLSGVLGRAVGEENVTRERFVEQANIAMNDGSRQLYVTRRGFEALNSEELAQRQTPHLLTDEHVRELAEAYVRNLPIDPDTLEFTADSKDQMIALQKLALSAGSVGAHPSVVQRIAAVFSAHAQSTSEMVHQIAGREAQLQDGLREVSDYYSNVGVEALYQDVQQRSATDDVAKVAATEMRMVLDPEGAIPDEGEFRRAALQVLRATLPDVAAGGTLEEALQVHSDYDAGVPQAPAPSEEQMDLLGTMIARVAHKLRVEHRERREDAEENVLMRAEAAAMKKADIEAEKAEIQRQVAEHEEIRGARLETAKADAYAMVAVDVPDILDQLSADPSYEDLVEDALNFGMDNEDVVLDRTKLILGVLQASIPQVAGGVGEIAKSGEHKLAQATAAQFRQLSGSVDRMLRDRSLEVPNGPHHEFIREQIVNISERVDAMLSREVEEAVAMAAEKAERVAEPSAALVRLLGEVPVDPIQRDHKLAAALIRGGLEGAVLQEGQAPQRYYPMQMVLESYKFQRQQAGRRDLEDRQLEQDSAKALMEALLNIVDDSFLQGVDRSQGLQSANTEYMRNQRQLDVCSQDTRARLEPIVHDVAGWLSGLTDARIDEMLVDM